MKTRTSRRGKAFGLLGAMLFLLIATSFHRPATGEVSEPLESNVPGCPEASAYIPTRIRAAVEPAST